MADATADKIFAQGQTGADDRDGLRANNLAKSFKGSYVPGSAEEDGVAAHDLTWVFGLVLMALVLLELREGWRAVWTSRKALR